MIYTDKGHFQITFKNGYTVLVFNGCGSYSENHFNNELLENDYIPVTSQDCEIAIFYEENPGEERIFCTNSFIETKDSVIGWISPEELAEIIIKVKNVETKKVESNE